MSSDPSSSQAKGKNSASPADELPEGTEGEMELPPSPLPSKVGSVTSKHSKATATTTTKRETTVKGQGSSKPQLETTEPITVSKGTSKSQGSHRSGNNNQNSSTCLGNGSPKNDSPSKTTVTTTSNATITSTTATANGKKSTTSSQSSPPVSDSSEPLIPPVKKIKTGSASSAAIRPSPLRTSITTTTPFTNVNNSSPKSPPSPAVGISPGAKKRKASMSNGSKASPLSQTKSSNGGANGHFGLKEEDDDNDSSYLNEGDDSVSNLSVKELEQDQENDPASTRPVKRDAVSRPKAASGGLGSKSNGNAQGRIMVELASRQTQPPPSPPSPPNFVIDKNQKARKWGKSGIVFQTLGGVVSIPLWTSDQEMLLNEPKPLNTHQSVPMMTTGRKDSSLARLAVLSQLDMDMDLDSPERGNTPDSLDGGSPGPTTPSLKKKRMSKRPQSDSKEENGPQGIGANKLLAIKKALQNKRARADSGNATPAEDLDGDDDSVSTAMATNPTSKASSARSTPAPTQQRPRTFPCSFEGCNKSFMDKFHLDRHEARHVTEEIVCGIDGCTKAYNSISTVRRHQSMMHKDKKLQMDAAAAASAAEVEAEAEVESSNSNNGKNNSKDGQANGKKVAAKKGKSKSAAPASPVVVPVALMLKDVKDSAYRPWMDSTESSTRTSSPLKDTKYEGSGAGQLKHHKSPSSTSSTTA
ncbi:hypothetical protein BGZ79_002014 [Entomortierella chlamydospora]|nr:hypothetical protein BGZ79_002014 [Entomortierella chlamydospora]